MKVFIALSAAALLIHGQSPDSRAKTMCCKAGTADAPLELIEIEPK